MPLVRENWKRMLYWRNNDCSSWAAPRDAQVFGVFGGDRSWRGGHSLFIRCCMRSTHSCLRIRRWATYASRDSYTRSALCTLLVCSRGDPPYRRGWGIRERSSKRSVLELAFFTRLLRLFLENWRHFSILTILSMRQGFVIVRNSNELNKSMVTC